MEAVQDYTLITTIAVALLVLGQLVFFAVTVILLLRMNKLVTKLRQTSDMSKDFIKSLRQEQLRRVPLWQLGLFAYKKARSLRRR